MTATGFDRSHSLAGVPARSRLPLSGMAILLAFMIDVAGAKWGSYIRVPGSPVFLADLLLVLGVVGGVRASLISSARGLGLSLAILIFVGFQVLRVLGSGVDTMLVLRDVAPLLYLALVPAIAAALRPLPDAALLRCVRFAATIMGLTVGLRATGVLAPVELLPQVFGYPLFGPRQDAEAVALGLGVLAFGTWPGLRSHRSMQGLLAIAGAVNYSRAGLIAVAVCVAVALWRERKAARRPGAVVAAVLAIPVLAGAVLVVPSPLLGADQLEALQRLTQTSSETGTTRARLIAWQLMLTHVSEQERWVAGFGPGTSPVLQSGAVVYLSGREDVRAAHNWAVTAIAYLGVSGLVLWCVVIARHLVVGTRGGNYTFAFTGVCLYLITGLVGVMIESPFGSLPLAVLLGWLGSRSSRMKIGKT